MSATTLTLTEFLLARIAEDETVARAAREHEYLSAARDASQLRWSRDAVGYGSIFVNSGRVLAECEAKRRQITHLVDFMEGDYAPWNETQLQIMASVYADHPDYRAEWRP